LVEVESRTEKRAAGATEPDQATVKGLIAQFAYWLEKEGKEKTYLNRIKSLANKGANLLDPEDVKAVIGKQTYKKATKVLDVYAYDAFAKMLGIQWTPPQYKQEEILPFIPDEAELDALIASCKSRRMGSFLQTLKETFADPGEALKLRWIDIDVSHNIITINGTVKGHRPRQLQVSNKLIAMLNRLPKKSEYVFPTRYRNMVQIYMVFRRRTADRLQNPRLLKISFNTFRHWGATMVYHYTRDILLVQKLLGHKEIKSTMKYTQLVKFKDDEFDVATATTVEDIKQLAEAGFEKFDELNGIHVFRRPKRFANIRR